MQRGFRGLAVACLAAGILPLALIAGAFADRGGNGNANQGGALIAAATTPTVSAMATSSLTASATSAPSATAPAPSSTATRTATATASPTAPPAAPPTARGPRLLPAALPRTGGPDAGALIPAGLAALALGLRLARRRPPGP